MKNLKQALADTKLVGQQTAMENYDHIVLSDEEKEEITQNALREARKKRHHEIKTREYWENINKPVDYPILNLDGTLRLFLKTIQQMNPSFAVNDFNKEIINLLAAYFAEHPSFEKAGYSLKKGIMIVGPVGCGKTSIMKAFAINSTNPFAVTTARKVAADYTDKTNGGDNVITKYSSLCMAYPQQNYGFDRIGYCFDDIGVEDRKKHFGNETDVIAEIIYGRYEAGLHRQTHFTANMTGDDIEEMYGSRIKSRLREMCNFIAFDQNSPDFRK